MRRPVSVKPFFHFFLSSSLSSPFFKSRARRYSFVASVELIDLQSELQFQGRATDLSLYGCGVAASKSLPAGTKLRVKITSKGCAFSAVGKVAYVMAVGDMGIVFARIEPGAK